MTEFVLSFAIVSLAIAAMNVGRLWGAKGMPPYGCSKEKVDRHLQACSNCPFKKDGG